MILADERVGFGTFVIAIHDEIRPAIPSEVQQEMTGSRKLVLLGGRASERERERPTFGGSRKPVAVASGFRAAGVLRLAAVRPTVGLVSASRLVAARRRRIDGSVRPRLGIRAACEKETDGCERRRTQKFEKHGARASNACANAKRTTFAVRLTRP